jgi:hypothetical protein
MGTGIPVKPHRAPTKEPTMYIGLGTLVLVIVLILIFT